MLKYFIQKVHKRRYLAKPRIVVCVPSGITGVEQRAVKDAGYAAGARKVYIIEEPMQSGMILEREAETSCQAGWTAISPLI